MSVNLNPIPAKWVLPDTLNHKYSDATTSTLSGIKFYLAPFSDAARESGIPNTLVKIAKAIGQYFSILEASIPASNFVANCNIFGDIVKVFNITKGVDDIVTNADKKNLTGIDLHQRNLSIASGFFQTIISGMGGVKLLNTFQLISLAEISTALGTTVVLPFSVAASGVEIVKNVVDISNKSLKIHKTNARRSALRTKFKNFRVTKATKDVANSTKIAKFLDDHIKAIELNQAAAAKKLEDQLELPAVQANVQKASDEYQKTLDDIAALKLPGVSKVQKLAGFGLHFKKWRKETSLFEAKEAHDKVVEDYEKTRQKLAGRVVKLQAWTNVKHQFEANKANGITIKRTNTGVLDDTDLVNQMISAKEKRWDTMRKNCNTDNLKDGVSIAISIVATIGLIATIVLTFTGIGTIPVLLTMTSLWLLVSIAGLGNTLLAKYKRPLVVPATNMNYFAAAA